MNSIRSLRELAEQAYVLRRHAIDELLKMANLDDPQHVKLQGRVKPMLEALFDDGDAETNTVFYSDVIKSYFQIGSVAELKSLWQAFAEAWAGKVCVKSEEADGNLYIVLSLPEQTTCGESSSDFKLMLWDGRKLHSATEDLGYIASEVLAASNDGDNLANVLVTMIHFGRI